MPDALPPPDLLAQIREFLGTLKESIDSHLVKVPVSDPLDAPLSKDGHVTIVEPKSGFLGRAALEAHAQRLTEALAAENFVEGLKVAVEIAVLLA